jgi:hypothetical protein
MRIVDARLEIRVMAYLLWCPIAHPATDWFTAIELFALSKPLFKAKKSWIIPLQRAVSTPTPASVSLGAYASPCPC